MLTIAVWMGAVRALGKKFNALTVTTASTKEVETNGSNASNLSGGDSAVVVG